MDPSAIPIELSRLIDLEKIIITIILPLMFVYGVKSYQYKYSDNVINYAQDVNSIARYYRTIWRICLQYWLLTDQGHMQMNMQIKSFKFDMSLFDKR